MIETQGATIWRFMPAALGVVVIATLGLLMAPHSTTDSTVWIQFLGHHVVVARNALAPIAPVVLLPIGILLPAWAIIHASRTPKSAFTSLGRSKGRWVVSMIVLFLVGDAAFLLLPIYYLIKIRPRLHPNLETAIV